MKVMDYYDGNTHVEIWDDCVISDSTKVQGILDRVGKIGTYQKTDQKNCLERAATLNKACNM